jgi:hypothetical protein
LRRPGFEAPFSEAASCSALIGKVAVTVVPRRALLSRTSDALEGVAIVQHAQRAEPRLGGLHVVALPVVLDGHPDRIGPGELEGEHHLAGAGVLADVVQGLFDKSEDGEPEVLGQLRPGLDSLPGTGNTELDGGRTAVLEAPDQRRETWLEADTDR